MDKVPISFEHMGKKYSCHFTAVRGGGSGIYHLMDNKNFYLGRLRQANDKWVFDCTPKKSELAEKAEFFGDYLTTWIE